MTVVKKVVKSLLNYSLEIGVAPFWEIGKG
jgi:hypothetical protein